MATNVLKAVASVALLGIFAAAGCNRGPNLAGVRGSVKLNGKPLGRVMVQFLPDPEKATTGPRSTAVTEADGHFTLICDNEQLGAVVGNHRVLVTDIIDFGPVRMHPRERADLQAKDPNNPARKSRIPNRYSDVAKTSLLVQVKPGDQTIDLELTAP